VEENETSPILYRASLRKRIRNMILHQAPVTREILGFRHYEYMYSPSQLGFLCQQITNTAEVPGSILEVGCAWGATTVFLNRHIDELGLDVDYYAVDTFEGFTDDDIRTEHERGRRYSYDTAFHANSKAWFDRTMRRNNVARVTSFRADAATFDYKKTAPFRFVLIDVDLHRPVLAALEAIYDLVSPGGTIIIDDCKQGGEWGGAYEAFIEFTQANGLDATIVHNKLGLIPGKLQPVPDKVQPVTLR
jgi:O-methyltransferase